jgi:predicted TIM-barrel fold metal-dependent hydrolase
MILPPLSTDCHMHVLGPFEGYPLAAERAYNVPEAPLEAHERMKRKLGLERTVLVQASGHGFDNRAMLAALAHLGVRGRAVAVLDPRTPAGELETLHACGVRGVRPGRTSAFIRSFWRLSTKPCPASKRDA